MELVRVVAAVIERGGRYLITRRLLGTHLGGLWEFPGGKILAGEKPEAGLERELMEELGVRAIVGELSSRGGANGEEGREDGRAESGVSPVPGGGRTSERGM